jgi:cysteine synthase
MIKTQIVEITDQKIGHEGVRIFTSVEGQNLGGSIKDHLVYHELDELVRSGHLQAGDSISEVSAGSTALSLAYYGKAHGLIVDLFIPTDTAPEKISQLQTSGAIIHLAPRETIYEIHAEYLQKHGGFYFNQLWDSTKMRHYANFGQNFENQIGPIDIILGAVGTGHSLKGVGNIESERYGPKDPCHAQDFHQRMIIDQHEFFQDSKLETDAGTLLISTSFRLVLGAVQKLLKQSASPLPQKLLAIGADNKIQKIFCF